jgi:hypothetical protein
VLPFLYSLKPHIIQSLSEEQFHEEYEHYLNSPGFPVFAHLTGIGSSSGGVVASPSHTILESEVFDADHLTHLLANQTSSVSSKQRTNAIRTPLLATTTGTTTTTTSVDTRKDSDDSGFRDARDSSVERSSFVTANSNLSERSVSQRPWWRFFS